MRFLAWVVAFAVAAAPAHRKPRDIPADPTNVETVAISLQGPCLGLGWHNPDETRVTDFGLSAGGLAVGRGAYDFMRPWAAGEACAPAPGISAELGVQYGQHPAGDAANPYLALGYRVGLGDGWDFRALGGGFYEGVNRKRRKTPITANFCNFYPFFAVEFHGQF